MQVVLTWAVSSPTSGSSVHQFILTQLTQVMPGSQDQTLLCPGVMIRIGGGFPQVTLLDCDPSR